MLRAAFFVGVLLTSCALGGCVPAPASQLPTTGLSPPHGSAPPTYDDVPAGAPRRIGPGYYPMKADDPNDPIWPVAHSILLGAAANGLPIFATIVASPTLSLREVEQAAATGELTNFGQHPGSTFLGAVGEALVIHDLQQQAAAAPKSLKLTPQPARPPGFTTDPDLLVVQDGFCQSGVLFNTTQTVSFTNTIGPGTGGLVGTVDLGPNQVTSYWEVTTSTSARNILPRGQRVAAWATALGGFSSPSTTCHCPRTPVTVAVLAIDRGAYFSLSLANRTKLVNTVTGAGGLIRLYRNLAGNSIQQAMTLAMQLAPVSRP